MISMARLPAALLLATLLVVGQWSDAAAAAPAHSEAEEFWRTVLPNSPLPDAILMLLHPETNPAKNAIDADHAQGLSRNNPFSYVGFTSYETNPAKNVIDADHAQGLSRNNPFSYVGFTSYGSKNGRDASHKHLSPRPPSTDDDDTSRTTSFFHEEALQVGRNLTFYFPQVSAAPLGLLPRHVADSIPFSVALLPDALALLGIAADSEKAAGMQQALEMCESPAVFCATSLEALVEAAIESLGTGDIRPVTSTLPPSGAPLQQYTISAVRPIDGSSFVACHDQYYPYTVFVCHSTGPSRAYMVDMEGSHGDTAITVATICHTDTSQWHPEHIAFKLLGTNPGGAPVCHILPNGHMMWAKNGI